MKNLFYIKDKKGFTLIEMLIVILIIVILLAIAVPSVIAYREDSQRTADLGAAKTVYTALEAALTNNPIDADAAKNAVWPWTYRDVNSDERFITSRFQISAGSYPLAVEMGAFMGEETFDGYVIYGYSLETNSIIWVSYQEEDNTPVDPGSVMVYDVQNDVSGYLDDLMKIDSTQYTLDIYGK